MKTQNIPIKTAVSLLGGQCALAKAIGTSQSTVCDWLNNKKKPSPQNAVLIVKATNGVVKANEIRPDLPELFPPDLAS